MSDILPIDMTDEALGLLPSQYADATNLRAYISALATTFQGIDDVLQQMQYGLDVANAQGVQLDHLGQRVGQSRRGGPYPTGTESDTDYRRRIMARSLADRSEGTAPEMQEVFSLLFGSNLIGADVHDVYPAAFVLQLAVTSPLTPDEEADAVQFMLLCKPAGVRCDGIVIATDPAFAFDGYPSPPGAGYDVGAWAKYIYP